MCGVVGIHNLTKWHPIGEATLRQMLALIRHRGPDQFGIFLDEQAALGSARLSIIDLGSGQQPIPNEDKTLWIVFNGEIFNYVELRPGLEAHGHRFTTQTDTEVLLHLYEEYGPACLNQLNGQFAFAIWDSQRGSLFLGRDRLGVRPLFYTLRDGALIFASEIKAILAALPVFPGAPAQLDPLAFDQVFTYWSTLSPRTAFKDIFELPPGHTMIATRGEIAVERYWQLDYPPAGERLAAGISFQDRLDEFRSLLVDATRLRLRADVPVGAYLSGGLDSSTTAAIIRNYTANHLDTFSITFSDPAYDESQYQRRMASFLGTDHHVVHATHAQIGEVFPQVIWHTEAPLLRTSPAPLFLLSRLVRQHGYKVVLTGEGADEFLAGYNIFKEALIRRFWARQPQSKLRPRLLKRIYPYVAGLSEGGEAYLAAFFGQGLEEIDSPDYSHAIRWRNTARTKRFFCDDLHQAIANQETEPYCIPYPPRFMDWHPLHRAQFLEINIFLSQYLLSSQGDRVAMAHSVEVRFPFLDYRLVKFCNRLPPEVKLRGLTEKFLLKQLAREWLPDEIWQRPKKPYRAPIQRSFFHENTPDYVRQLLSQKCLRDFGMFKPAAVAQLVKKAEGESRLGETDEMALVGILSSQLLYQQFIEDFRLPPPLSEMDDVKVCFGKKNVYEPAMSEARL